MIRRVLLGFGLFILSLTVGLWVTSYGFKHGFGIRRDGPQVRFQFLSKRGRAVVIFGGKRLSWLDGTDLTEWDWGAMNSESEAWLGVFSAAPIVWSIGSAGWWSLRFNYSWIVLPLAVGCSVLYWPIHRRKRRRRRGCCVSCGYDLRLLEGSRCPECAEPFEPGPKESAHE